MTKKKRMKVNKYSKNGKCTIPVHLKLAELKVIINADLNGVRVFSFSPTSLETERELDITFEVDE